MSMAIHIVDPELEAKVKELGRRQLAPVSKTKMATSILRYVMGRCDGRGGPVQKWKATAEQAADELIANTHTPSPDTGDA